MRRLALALLVALAIPAAWAIPPDVEPSVLSATVNGAARHDGAIFWLDGDQWVAQPLQWKELGLLLSDDELALPSLSAGALGVSSQFDENSQSIALRVPADRLPTQKISPRPSMPQLSPVAPGLLINYNLAGQHGPGGTAVSLAHDLRTSGRWGTLRSSGQLNWTEDGGQYRRGLTQWSLDDYNRLVRYEAGDVVSSGTSRTVLGGVRVSKDHSLDPYTPTWPLPTLGGVALDPTTVEILANEAKVADHEVGAGNFQIERFPLNPGRNTYDVVVRDQFGRTQLVSSSQFYFAPRLLRDGLTTWSFAAGSVRQGTTNQYDGLGASFDVAHGLSDRWTLSASAQTTGQNYNATVGARTVLGTAGTLEVEAGRSSSELGDGSYLRGQYNYQGQNFGVALSLESTDDWWSLAANDGFVLQARQRTQAALTWQSQDRNIRAKFGAVDLDTGRSRTRYLETGLSYRSGPHSISGTALYDLERGEPVVAATYRYNLGKGSVYASARQAPDGSRYALGGSAQADIHGQRVMLRGELTADNGQIGARAAASTRTAKGAARMELDTTGSGTRVSGSWEGSVHIGQGGMTVSDTIHGGFAVVEVPGVPGATVRANGREIGKTNASGRLLLPQLSELSETRVRVDTRSLPAGVELKSSEIVVAPRRRTGAYGQFEVLGTEGRAFTLVRTPALETGAAVKTDEEETMAGHGGQIYLERPVGGMSVVAEDSHGSCQAQLPEVLPSFDDLVELSCQ